MGTTAPTAGMPSEPRFSRLAVKARVGHFIDRHREAFFAEVAAIVV